MEYLLSTAVLLSFPAYFVLALYERRRRPIFRSAYLRSLAWFVTAFLWVVAFFVVIPTGLNPPEDPRMLLDWLRPLFALGLIAVATGLALPIAIEKPEARSERRTFSGKEFLAITMYVGGMHLLRTYEAYINERPFPFGVLCIVGAVAVSFGLLPFIRRMRATWRQPGAINWLLFLYCSPLFFAGYYMTRLSIQTYIEQHSTVYSHIRAHPSGIIAMEASIAGNTRSFVCDHLGREFTGLPDDVELFRGRGAWSHDGRHLYLLGPGTPDGRRNGSGLWRFTPRRQEFAFLRPLPDSFFRMSPDGRKVLFVTESWKKEKDEEDETLTQLVCGNSDNRENDRVICEGRIARVWPFFCCWHPSSGKVYFTTYSSTSLGEQPGLWSVDCSEDELGEPAFILAAKEITRVACNASGSHLALLSRLREGESVKDTVLIVELPTRRVTKEIPLASPMLISPSGDLLVWDGEGVRLCFADGEGLKVLDLSTGEVRLVVRARPTPEGPFYHEILEPMMWLPDGNLLFFQWFSTFRTYNPASLETEDSPLNKRIAKWVRTHGSGEE